MKVSDILVIGNIYVDFTMKMSEFPEDNGISVSRENYLYTAHSYAADTAIAAARLGTKASLCGRIGNDFYGDLLSDVLTSNRVSVRDLVRHPDMQTGLVVTELNERGAYRRVMFPGANRFLLIEDVASALSQRHDAVCINLSIADTQASYITKTAHNSYTTVVVDAEGVSKDFPIETLGRVDIFCLDEEDALTLTGIQPRGVEERLRVCIDLCRRLSIGFVVLRMKDRGAFVYNGTYCNIISPYDVPVIDTTAANAAFTAALTAEYLNTQNIEAAVDFANAAWGRAVSVRGAIASLPFEKDIRKLMNEEA